MEALGRVAGGEDTDGGRQVVVGAEDQALERKRPRQIDVGHLGAGVYAGVRAARSDDRGTLADQPGKRRFDALLHGVGIGLALPAAELFPQRSLAVVPGLARQALER